MKGCGDYACVIEKPKGMGTNSRCRCPEWKLRKEVLRLRTENERFREAFEAIKANPTYSYLDAIRMKNIADAATDGRVCKCADNQGGPYEPRLET